MAKYKIVDTEYPEVLSGAVSQRTIFEVGNQLFLASRVINTKGQDETRIFPATTYLDEYEIDMDRFAEGDWPRFFDVTATWAIERWLKEYEH